MTYDIVLNLARNMAMPTSFMIIGSSGYKPVSHPLPEGILPIWKKLPGIAEAAFLAEKYGEVFVGAAQHTVPQNFSNEKLRGLLSNKGVLSIDAVITLFRVPLLLTATAREWRDLRHPSLVELFNRLELGQQVYLRGYGDSALKVDPHKTLKSQRVHVETSDGKVVEVDLGIASGRIYSSADELKDYISSNPSRPL